MREDPAIQSVRLSSEAPRRGPLSLTKLLLLTSRERCLYGEIANLIVISRLSVAKGHRSLAEVGKSSEL
jgi:hypothetical protein